MAILEKRFFSHFKIR